MDIVYVGRTCVIYMMKIGDLAVANFKPWLCLWFWC